MKKLFTIFLYVVLYTFISVAQTETNVIWLNNFAEEEYKKWEMQRAEAESLAALMGIPVWFEYADGSVIELQRFEHGLPVYDATDNLNAARTISTNHVWSDGLGGFNLSGSGQIMGLWESGGYPLPNHQELIGRMVQMDAGSPVTQHATHVAGTQIASGVNPNAIGMSNAGTIHYYNSASDLSEVAAAAAAGLRVTNHSYGAIRGWRFNYFNDNLWAWLGDVTISETEDWQFGFYSSTSAAWDNMLFNAPYILVVKSAGNDRGEGPAPGTTHWVFQNGSWQLSQTVRDPDGGQDRFDCINDHRGIAKNTLTIGAVDDIPGGYQNPSNVIMSSFSNWGPTDDGRIKPDVVANGVSLTSSSNTSPTAYANLSGTSMSAPNVSGSVGLLLQHQQNLYGSNPLRAATIKALIIHTADEAGAAPGPDYTFGWGLMNTLSAVKHMQLNADVGGNMLIKEEVLSNGGQFDYQVQSNGQQPLVVTISWTDPLGTPPAPALNPPNIMLVNDLDVRIIGPGGNYLPWILDRNNPSLPAAAGDNIRDNTEQVFIENPPAGSYTIRVTHKGTLQGGSQAFSMIVSGIIIPVPANVSLIYPPNGATSLEVNPMMNWSMADRGYDYHLQVSENAQFTSLVVDKMLKGIKYQPTELLGIKTYYWRVRAINSGGAGQWSDIWSFTTMLVPPPSPLLYLPDDKTTNVSLDVDFLWGTSHSADNYRLQVSANILFSQILFDDSTLTDTSKLVTGLPDGTRIFWRVNAKNQAGFGLYSPVRRFITLLPPPSDLTAVYNEAGYVELNWTDNSQNETKYFIQRKVGADPFVSIDSLGANANAYNDASVLAGQTYTYRVFCSNTVAVSDFSNEVQVTTVVSVDDNKLNLPEKFELFANYPNPFNPYTTIKYALPFDSYVKIIIYNQIGEVVDELVNNQKAAGYHEVIFRSENFSSGVYFYSIDAAPLDGNDTFSSVGKMILLK